MAAQQSKKQRKHGRNALSCAAYARTNQREKNKLVKLARRLAKHPNDKAALAAVERAKVAIRGF